MADKFAPGFTAAKLYRKTSKTGATYFAGRLGGVKVALLKSKDTADDGGEIWNLVFSEAAPYAPKTDNVGSVAADHQAPRRSAVPSGGPADMNDHIPF